MASELRRAWLLLLAIPLSYARAIGYGFVFDDHHHIEGHPGVTGPFSLRAIFGRRFFGHVFGDPDGPMSYRPLTTLSYAIDHRIGGPAVFHTMNLAWFAATLLSAWWFLDTWLGKSTSARARLLAVIGFATLSLHIDIVPNLAGRAEMMAMTFSLLALTACLRPSSLLSRAGAVLLFSAAILSKESAIAMPLLGAWLAFRTPLEGEDAGQRLRRTVPLAVGAVSVVGAYLAFRHGRLPLSHGDERHLLDNVSRDWPFHARISAGFQALAHYVKHVFVGVDLCPDYSYAAIVPTRGFGLALSFGLLMVGIGVFAFVSWSRRRHPAADVPIAFAASYVAVSNFVLPSVQLVADRLFFFPSFFLVVGIAVALDDALRVPKQRVLAATLAGVVVLVQVLLAQLQMGAWANDETLARSGVERCPTNLRLRISDGRLSRSADEAAMDFLVAVHLFRSSPAPLGDEPWIDRDDLPLSERVELARKRFGPQGFADLRARAQSLAVSQGRPDAARLLAGL